MQKQSKQLKDIKAYLRTHNEVEVRWPLELLHKSKYGSFSSILQYINGEYLLMLDSDHSITIEEMVHLPYITRLFRTHPLCDAIGVRLTSFNEKYNPITELASISNNSWCVNDMRVKALIGGGGVFGKFIVRVSAIREKELVQPDSVAEDMLAMTRFLYHNSEILFSEEMEIGQGEDISYYGLKKKYGRYPVGAVESSSTKLFLEMIFSYDVPFYRKADTLFMLSYYPVQCVILLSHFLIFGAWMCNVEIGAFLPFNILILTWMIGALSDSLLVWVYLYEGYGVKEGTQRYLATLMQITLFYGAYFYHYTEQIYNTLKGYAKFNMSEKAYNLSESQWFENYKNNTFSFQVGSLLLAGFFTGLVLHAPAQVELLFILPFVVTTLVWTFCILLFLPRSTTIWAPIEIIGEMVFILFRSYYDLLRKVKDIIFH